MEKCKNIYIHIIFSFSYSTGGLCLCLTLLILCVYMKWKTKLSVIASMMKAHIFWKDLSLFLMYYTHWLCCLPFRPFTLLSQNSKDFLLFHCSQNLTSFSSIYSCSGHSFFIDLIFWGRNYFKFGSASFQLYVRDPYCRIYELEIPSIPLMDL